MDNIRSAEGKDDATSEKRKSSESVADASVHNGVITSEQTLKKRYGLVTMIAMFLAGTAGWETIVATIFQALMLGGPTALFWGFFVSFSVALCVAFSLGELASSMPSNAGQYHWSVVLAPPKYGTKVGWMTAWILLFEEVVGSISATCVAGIEIQSIAIVIYDDYVPERWHSYLIFLALLIASIFINIFNPRWLHHISIVAMFFHFFGFFAVSITLLVTTKPKNSPKLVFGTLLNYSGWTNDGLAFLMGILPSTFSFMGIDSVARFTEETENPRQNIPRAMVWGVIGSAILVLPFIVVITFCMGDPISLLESDLAELNPLAQIVLNSTGSTTAVACLCSILVIIVCCVAPVQTAGIARLIMAQARDSGIPFAATWSKVDPRYNVPIPAILLATALQAIIGVVYIANKVAFYGICSGVVTLQAVSYAIVISLKVFRRGKHGMPPGPWRIKYFGLVVDIIALFLYSFLFVLMCLPTELPVSSSNMNYAVLITGGIIVITIILYICWGRKHYFGHLVDVIETPDGHNMVNIVKASEEETELVDIETT